MRRSLCVICLTLTLAVTAAGAADNPWGFAAELGTYSNYVWRGERLSEGLVASAPTYSCVVLLALVAPSTLTMRVLLIVSRLATAIMLSVVIASSSSTSVLVHLVVS